MSVMHSFMARYDASRVQARDEEKRRYIRIAQRRLAITKRLKDNSTSRSHPREIIANELKSARRMNWTYKHFDELELDGSK